MLSAVQAAREEVEAARTAGAPQHTPSEFAVLEDALEGINQNLERWKVWDYRHVHRYDCEQLKEKALAIKSTAKHLLWKVRLKKFAKVIFSPLESLGAVIERHMKGLQQAEHQAQQKMMLVTGLLLSIAGGVTATIYYKVKVRSLRRKAVRRKMQQSLSVREGQQKKGATSVDLGYAKAMEAAKSRSTAKTDTKEQKRLHDLLERRIKTGAVLLEATKQEIEIQTAANKIHEARGDYSQLPPMERAKIEREIAEQEAGFYDAKAKTAEAQKKIAEHQRETKDGAAFKRAIVWRQRVDRERNFLDPEFRQSFAKANRSQILGELREKWASEYDEVMQDTALVGWLYNAFPDVLDWLKARADVVRLAERFEVMSQAEGGQL